MSKVETAELLVRGDERGNLVAIEGSRELPFEIRRAYFLFGTKRGVVRGLHAHRTLRQAAVAVSGQCTIEFDDGQSRSSVDLNDPATMVMIEPMIWHEMRNFSPDCVLLVLADAVYDERDYIRDRAEFLRLVNEN